MKAFRYTFRQLRRSARAVLITTEITLRQIATDGFIIFGLFIQPLLVAFLGLWMLENKGGDYAIFVVVGSSMTGLWTSILFISGISIMEERWTRTLELLVATPTPLFLIAFGKNLAYVAQWLFSIVFSYTVVSVVFGYPLEIRQPVFFALSLGLIVVSFICFGLIMATFFLVNPELDRWKNGLEYPVYMLSGFLFPIALLPGWTTPFSYLLSPYWAARVLHATSQGTADLREIVLTWGMLILFSILYVTLSLILFRKALYKVRVDATLSQY